MRKSRLIFYIIFAAFQIFLVAFSLYVDNQKEDFHFLLSLQSKIGWLKYGSFLGVILLGIDFFWNWKVMRDHEKEKGLLQNELNSTKARMFDMQEETRNAPSSAPRTSAQSQAGR